MVSILYKFRSRENYGFHFKIKHGTKLGKYQSNVWNISRQLPRSFYLIIYRLVLFVFLQLKANTLIHQIERRIGGSVLFAISSSEHEDLGELERNAMDRFLL